MIPLVYKGILLKNAMGFNRTFMELKPKSERYDIRRTEGFNRTFMELKRHIINAVRLATVVLIGPSWN